MKKKISVLAAVLLAFGLTACGNNATQASNDTILSGGEKSLASWIHLWRVTALMALR